MSKGDARVSLIRFAIPIVDPIGRFILFVMGLPWSGKLFARFISTDDTPSILSCLVSAFRHFGAIPRRIYFETMACLAVRRKGVLCPHPEVLELAERYRFEHRPVNPAEDVRKGRIEMAAYSLQRAFRDAYVDSRNLHTFEDLNRWVLDWCRDISDERPCPQAPGRTVNQEYEEERLCMSPLPGNPSPPDEASKAYLDGQENGPRQTHRR